MLISRSIRKKLTVLAIGTGLFAGCSSGPQLSSVRFWPGGEKMESAADDEAVAKKWRDRLNASAFAGGLGDSEALPETADAVKPRSGRFNLFRRFSRDETPDDSRESATAQNSELQRQLLERRIAELEAEQRNLQQQRNTAQPTAASSFDPRRVAKENDPFLAAAQVNPSNKQIVRPPVRTAPPGSQSPATPPKTGLPSWAQGAETPEPPAASRFSPGFNESLNQLEASVQPEPKITPSSNRAPAMPDSGMPVVTPQKSPASAGSAATQKQNPFAAIEEQQVASAPDSTAAAPQAKDKSHPKLDKPVPEPGLTKSLASLRSVEEQQQAMAHLEVQQLLKRSRIQARAGQLNEALATALAAEQLANSAQIQFSNREQTPAQLVSLIKMKAAETPVATAQNQPEPQSNDAPEVNWKGRQTPEPRSNEQHVLTKPVTPPQWPSRNELVEPRQVKNDRPLVSTPTEATKSSPAGELKTAEFLHPRPAQARAPYASTSDQWYSTEDHPLNRTQEVRGGYMETASTAAPHRPRNEINAQFVSSKSIYSPENLQWTSLDASRSTLDDRVRIPAPPVSPVNVSRRSEPPPFAESEEVTADDPFAAVFGEDEVSDASLNSDDPLQQAAPAMTAKEKLSEEPNRDFLIWGIPARKLGLVALAGMILLAAIVHRRRTSDIHEL